VKQFFWKYRKPIVGCCVSGAVFYTYYKYYVPETNSLRRLVIKTNAERNEPTNTIRDLRSEQNLTPTEATVTPVYDSIIVGGGTAGCMFFESFSIDRVSLAGLVAYLLAKWMEAHGVPGRVLLLERGLPYVPKDRERLGVDAQPVSDAMATTGDLPSGDSADWTSQPPHPSISRWFDNWGALAISHDTEAEGDTWQPVPASAHVGLGGCGAHDTRISFIPTREQAERCLVWFDLVWFGFALV
jgi:hypothetical protein